MDMTTTRQAPTTLAFPVSAVLSENNNNPT